MGITAIEYANKQLAKEIDRLNERVRTLKTENLYLKECQVKDLKEIDKLKAENEKFNQCLKEIKEIMTECNENSHCCGCAFDSQCQNKLSEFVIEKISEVINDK